MKNIIQNSIHLRDFKKMVNILNYSSKKEKMVNIPIGCPRTQLSFGKKKTTQALAFHRFSISSFLCRNNNKIAGGI